MIPRMGGMGLSLGLGLSSGGVWTPARLFGASDVGVTIWTDSQQTNFQEHTGETLAGDGNTVGLVLDRSGGLALGSELAPISAAGWNLGTDWSYNGGTLTYNGAGGANASAVDGVTNEAWYRVVLNVTIRSGDCRLRVGSGGANDATITTSGTHTFTIQADGTAFILRAAIASDFDVIVSYKELAGNHFTQDTASKRPTLNKTGNVWYWEGDGIDDWIRSTFTITQPWTRVSAIRQNTWTLNRRIFGGVTAASGRLYQTSSTPSLRLFSGASTPNNSDAALGTDVIATERHDGTNSRLAINNNAYVTGDAGTGLPGGITMFASNTGATPGDARCYGLTMIDRDLSDAEIALTRQFHAQYSPVVL